MINVNGKIYVFYFEWRNYVIGLFDVFELDNVGFRVRVLLEETYWRLWGEFTGFLSPERRRELTFELDAEGGPRTQITTSGSSA